MRYAKYLSAATLFCQGLCNIFHGLHTQTSGENAQALVSIHNHGELCLLPPGLSEFDKCTLRHNNSSEQQPTCVWSVNHEKQYCVFADPQFRHGKGIVIITTPERAKHIFKLSTFTSSHPTSIRGPLFRTRTSGGKGRGIFASRHIAAGSLVTTESPIIFLDRNWLQDVPAEEVRLPLIASAIESLPSTTRQVFYELYVGADVTGNEHRMWTNGYGIGGGPTKDWPSSEGESDLGMIAVHANISKINHGCRPNTVSQWNWDSFAHEVYAARDIAADEEITISYINPLQTFRERQEYTKQTLGFECACTHCMAGKKFTDLSDDRIKEILLLEQHLESREIAPAEPTAMAELLVSLYKDEGLDYMISKAYAIAALEWNGVGSEFQARSWAYQSLKAGLVSGSEAGVTDYLMDMEALLNGAIRHWSWRYRVHS